MNLQLANIKVMHPILSSTLLFAFLLVTGCGGGNGGYAGNQDDKKPPVAIASVLTLENTSTSTTKSYKARAGSQVVLTGKDSFSDYAPILTYEWKQLSGQEVTLVERTSNAVAFDIPASETASEFRFQLTVIDANGKSHSDAVKIDALPINDANRFLSHPNAPRNKLALLAALNGGEDTGSSAQSFSLEIITRAHWLNRLEVMDSIIVNTQELSSSFPKNFHPAANYDPITEVKNPRLEANLVLLNIDAINKNFETEQRDRRLDAHQIGTAYLTIEISVQGTPAVNFELFALNGTGDIIDTTTIQSVVSPLAKMTTSASTAAMPRNLQGSPHSMVQTAHGIFSTTILMDSLLAKLGLENTVSANNYYALLDPSGQFSLFSQWSKYAGFTDANGKTVNDPSITHALYLNNYDLGFGRDMWLRKDNAGNVYSYVTNYPTVEAGLEGRQDFAIVAMEYSDNPDTNGANSKIVKFYAFVPDERTGDYIRASSMNFDGRGEKFLPGVCTACHQSYQDGSQFTDVADADLDATFMPWDLDSFLFTSAVNPAFVEPTLDASKFTEEKLKKYSRESQEVALRNLNLGALATFKDDPVRHAAAIQLIHGWYGDAALELAVDQLPENTFDSNYIQPGWQSEPELYHQSFARNCRICHVQIKDEDTNFDTYAEFVSNDKLIRYVFELGQMPMARLTMDRFWLGKTSGAEILKTHLEGVGETVPAMPGAPNASFTASNISPDTGELVTLTATSSNFDQTYNWALTAPQGSSAELTATSGIKSSFIADLPGADFILTMTATNQFGAQKDSSQTLTSFDKSPIAPCITADTTAISEAGALMNIPIVSNLNSNQIGDGSVTITNTIDGGLGIVTIDSNAQTLSYQLTNPLVRGVDLVSFQLSDSNGSLSTTDTACTSGPNNGFGHLTIDTTNAGTLTPTNLTATADTINNSFEIDLAWAAPTDITPTGYRIYRGTTLLAEQLARNYSDAPLPHGSNFNYSVTTVFNGFESNASNLANASTQSLTPTNLTGDNSVFGQISLSWDAPSGVNNPITYSLYRSNGGITVTLATLLSSTGPFVDSTVDAGNTYDYTVTATDSSTQESDPSNTVSNTAKPSHPDNLSAATVSTAQINLSWDAVVDASMYKVYRKLSSEGVGSYTLIASPGSNSYSVTSGLSAGNAYDFRVGATVNGEDSVTYAVASATTRPNTPTSLTAGPNNAGNKFTQTVLNWSAPSGDSISGYNIYRSGSGLIASNSAGTSYVDSALASGTLYSYTIEAVAGGQASAATAAASGATYPNAPSPSASAISAGADTGASGKLRLSWPVITGDSLGYTISATGTRIIGGAGATPVSVASFADTNPTVARTLTGMSSYSNYAITVTASANGLASSTIISSSTGASYSSDVLTGPATRIGCAGCHSDAANLRVRFTHICIQTNNLPSCGGADTSMDTYSLTSNEHLLITNWFANQYD